MRDTEAHCFNAANICVQDKDDIDTGRMVARIANIFRPAELAVVATADRGGDAPAWGAAISTPAGYGILGRTVQDLRSGGRVTFLSLAVDVADGGIDTDPAAAEPLPRPVSPANSAASSSSGLLCPPVPQPYQGAPSAYLSDSEEGTLGSDSGIECGNGGSETAMYAASAAASSEPPQPAAIEPHIKPQPLVALGAAFEDIAAAVAASPGSEAVAAVMAKHGTVPLPAVDASALDAHISALIEVAISAHYISMQCRPLSRIYTVFK